MAPCRQEGCGRPRYVNRSGTVYSYCQPHDRERRRDRRGRPDTRPTRPTRPTGRGVTPTPTPTTTTTGNLSAGGDLVLVSPATRLRQERIDSGEAHVIADVRFGPERFTVCVCGWRCTGRTDDAMARTWNAHPYAMRVALREARDRAGVVRVVPDGDADLGSSEAA